VHLRCGDRQRCGFETERSGAGPIRIEVKGCWRVLVDEATNMRGATNGAFRKHLDRASHDIDKLHGIASSAGSHVGWLLVGSDTGSHPITTNI
jgi:hypothetical protein